QELQIAGQRYAFGPQPLHSRLVKNVHRCAQSRQTQNRRIPYLPSVGARHGLKSWPHLEPGLFVMPPPAGKARQIPGPRMPLMNKTTSHTSGTTIQIFVTAPN